MEAAMTTTNKQSKRGSGGRSRQPLGLVSTNTTTKKPSSKAPHRNTFLPPKYISTSAAGANVEHGDDESSIASTASRFSYRGIKHTISLKKKRGLVFKFGRKASSKTSMAANELLDYNADAFAYKEFDMLSDRCVEGPSVEFDEIHTVEEDDDPSVKQEPKPLAALEVVDLDGRAVRSPHVVCELPSSLVSPSWSEYGSAMLANWSILEKAATCIASPAHSAVDVERNEQDSDVADMPTDSTEDVYWDPPEFHPIDQDGEYCSRPCSPLGDFVVSEQGSVPNLEHPDVDHNASQDLYPVPLYSGSTSFVISPKPASVKMHAIEIERDAESQLPRQRKPNTDQIFDTNDLESDTPRYMVMNDVATLNLIQCFAPLTSNVTGRLPVIIAMTFGIMVILIHIVWVLKQ